MVDRPGTTLNIIVSQWYKCFFFKEDELISGCMSPSTAGVNSFKLHDRAIHVYSEASRVFKFKSVCEEKPANAIQVRTFVDVSQSFIFFYIPMTI